MLAVRGAPLSVPAMSNGNPAYAITLVALIERIGIDLRERYRPTKELPPMWLTMLCRLDANPEAPDRDTKGKFEVLT